MPSAKQLLSRSPGLGRIMQDNARLRTDNGVLQLEKGQLEAEIRKLKVIGEDPRTFLAHQFIRGSGIEIGAAQYPLQLPPRAKVKYVDVFSTDELKKIYSVEYGPVDMVAVDVVDDAEKLRKFKPSSLDFIIANHFLEHCLDPVGTVLNMYAKLRTRGILYMAIPDMRYTFDRARPLTTYAHLLEEHQDQTKTKFRVEHTYEAIRLAGPLDGTYRKQKIARASIEAQVQAMLDSGFRIHYHVWTQKQIIELFERLADDFAIALEIEAVIKNRHEVIFVLRKEPSTRLRAK